ncbi:MAG: hypothetical protein N3A72_06780, partial [bacterium]|nr:hypothetical protein [bacterium]
MMYSPVTAGFLAGNGLLIWLLYKLKFKKITFIAKLCIDLGLLMAGIAIFLTGISMLKSKIVPDEVSILWVIAGVSFGIGIILTAITKPERALKISMIVTASIGSVFTIYYLFLIFSSAVSGRFEFNAIWSMFIALSVTVVFIGLELLLYRFRRSKFAWLWLVTIFGGGIFTGLGVGTGIVLC